MSQKAIDKGLQSGRQRNEALALLNVQMAKISGLRHQLDAIQADLTQVYKKLKENKPD